MREIKFRVWNGSSMEYHVMAGYLGAFYVAGMDPRDAACMSPANTIYPQQTHTMQYTGIKDLFGREIFEGDYVVCPERRHMGDEGVVEYAYTGRYVLAVGSFKTSLHELVWNKWRLEVVGNIYENPELLKQA